MEAEYDEDAMGSILLVAETLKETGSWMPIPGKRHVAITLAGHETVNIAPQEQDHTVIIVRQHAEVTIIERSPHHAGTYIYVEENAKVRYITHSKGKNQRFVYLKGHAHLVWTDIALNSMESENIVYLHGDGAHARFGSIFLGKGDDVCMQNATMIHKGSHTSSHMLTRAVMLEQSKGSYRGLISILPGAKGCDAYQREDTLLLGDHSRMDALPVLEISNDDVKCSHGVTLGQVDAEQLFYLESRGIPQEDAVAMIVQGFFDQMLIAMGEFGEQFRTQLAQVCYG